MAYYTIALIILGVLAIAGIIYAQLAKNLQDKTPKRS